MQGDTPPAADALAAQLVEANGEQRVVLGTMIDRETGAVANTQGWCAFHQEKSRNLFVKRHTWETGAVYPDKGANYETYTAGTYMEVETLGPLRRLAPGESADHTETWQLFGEIDLGPTDDTAEAAIQNAFTRSRSIESSVS